jgi:hypothetical protein
MGPRVRAVHQRRPSSSPPRQLRPVKTWRRRSTALARGGAEARAAPPTRERCSPRRTVRRPAVGSRYRLPDPRRHCSAAGPSGDGDYEIVSGSGLGEALFVENLAPAVDSDASLRTSTRAPASVAPPPPPAGSPTPSGRANAAAASGRGGRAPDPEPSQVPVGPAVVAAALLALALGMFLRGAVAGRLRKHRAGVRARRAVAGEDRSEALLRRRGYTVLERQPRRRFVILVDDCPHAIEVRADWLVERDGARFVADTKTGRVAPSVEHAPTRRQLLEYRLVYDVSGVLLIDAEANEVRSVLFPGLPPRGSGAGTRRLVPLLIGCILGLGLALLALVWQSRNLHDFSLVHLPSATSAAERSR